MRRPRSGDHEARPFGYGYGYEPPMIARGRPAVITWFRVYAGATVLLYLASLAWWIREAGSGAGSAVVLAVGSIALALGTFCAVAALVPYKPWGWTVGLIAICLGLSSCVAVVAIPLLIYWMKPETKAAFGRL